MKDKVRTPSILFYCFKHTLFACWAFRCGEYLKVTWPSFIRYLIILDSVAVYFYYVIKYERERYIKSLSSKFVNLHLGKMTKKNKINNENSFGDVFDCLLPDVFLLYYDFVLACN